MHKETATHYAQFHKELRKISSHVFVMKDQSPFTAQDRTSQEQSLCNASGQEQSLHTSMLIVCTEEQSSLQVPPQSSEQNFFDNRDIADRTEPPISESTHRRVDTMARDWGEFSDDDPEQDYDQQIYWHPDDSDSSRVA